MAIPVPYNTNLSESQIAEAFRRALNDFTDDQIVDMLADKVSISNIDTELSTASDYPVQNKVIAAAVESDRSALAELVDSGAKNLLKPKSVITTSPTSGGGLTVTRNDDGSITINGTATSAVFIYICADDEAIRAKILNKKVVLSGCPEGGTTGGYRLRCWHYDGALNVGDYGSSVLFTFSNANTTYHFDIAIDSGVVCDNLTFSPMLCSKAAWDISHGYVPYRPSYDELIARIEALEGGT